MYGEPSSSGGASGRTCHHDWPAACSQSTNRYASGPSRPPGSEVGCSTIPAERGSVTRVSLAVLPEGHVPMAAPRTKRPPARIQIQDVSPQVDCGRYPYKRTVGDRVDVRARIFRDGHETLGAAVRWKPRAESKWRESPLTPVGNDWWEGSFIVDECGPWCYRSRPGSTASRPGRSRCGARPTRARRISPASSPRAQCARRAARSRSRRGWPQPRASAARRRGRRPTTSTSIASAPASAPGTSSSRARGAASRGVEEVLPQLAGLGFDVVYLPPIHPIGRLEPQGPQQRGAGGGGRRGQPVGDRRRRGRPQGDPSGARHGQGLRAPRAPRPRSRLRDLHRLRHPVLARPPVAE